MACTSLLQCSSGNRVDVNQAGKPAYATGGSPKAAPSRLEREEEGRLALYGTASGPASIDRPTAGSNTTLTAQPLGLAPANSALRCFPRADSTSALYGTASGPASIDRPTAGSNTTLTAQPLGLAPANSALRCFPRADSTSALYSTSHDTLDDVLLADEVEHDDRNDREHEAGHHRTHVD